MLLHNKRIAIVGGGMAGLTLARLLQMKNTDVKVYERDFNQQVRVQGSTLDLHESSGLEAMKRAGLLNEFYKHHRPEASNLLLLDNLFNVKFNKCDVVQNPEDARPEIDRAPLRDILLKSLKPDTVVWDSQFVSMEKEKNGWRLHFKNGSTAYADLVVAADGSSSKIRPYISDIKPIFSGYMLIQADVDDTRKNTPKMFALGEHIIALGNEQFISYITKGDGSTMFVISFKTHEKWFEDCGIDFKNREQVFEWFKKEFVNWSDEWHEIFTNNEVVYTPRSLYYFPLDQSWETLPNLTMIGDAAHRMPPFAGEGANVAMQDAFELAEVLTNGKFADIKTAIAHFEKDMVKRSADAIRQTLDIAEKMFSKTGLEQMTATFKGINISDKTKELTNLHPDIIAFQNSIRAKYAMENRKVLKGQILFVGSSLMEIFPIEQMQQNQDLGLNKVIYNRGVRATTTADLLNHINTLIFDLAPSKIFINIGSNDIGFNVPEEVFLANYNEILQQIKEKLPNTRVYVMAYYPINTVDNFGEEEKEHDQLYEHRSNEKLQAVNAKVERLAHKFGYKFINVNAGLIDSRGNLRKELTFDGAHMLPNGYEIVLENMKIYLAEK